MSLLACATKFAKFADHIDEAIVITGASDGKIVHCNDAWVRMCGYTREEALGSTNSLLQGARTDMAVADALDNALTHGAPEARAVLLNYKKGGERFWNDLVVLAVPGFFVGFLKETTFPPTGPRDTSRAAELMGCRRVLAMAFSEKALLPWMLPPVAHASAYCNFADAYAGSDLSFVKRVSTTGAPMHAVDAKGGGSASDDCGAGIAGTHHIQSKTCAVTGVVELKNKAPGGGASGGGASGRGVGARRARERTGNILSLPAIRTNGARGGGCAYGLVGNLLGVFTKRKTCASGRVGRVYLAPPAAITL
jgi:PAS domain S-box-containing protein